MGAISLQEKSFADTIFLSFKNGMSLDHYSLISEWRSIEKGMYDGLYSGALTSIYVYSGYYWQEFSFSPGSGDEDDVAALHLADALSGAVGYANYMYDNWDDHWYDDFGKKALEAGGNAALDGSSFGLWSAWHD